jgi:hypothetical protein
MAPAREMVPARTDLDTRRRTEEPERLGGHHVWAETQVIIKVLAGVVDPFAENNNATHLTLPHHTADGDPDTSFGNGARCCARWPHASAEHET